MTRIRPKKGPAKSRCRRLHGSVGYSQECRGAHHRCRTGRLYYTDLCSGLEVDFRAFNVTTIRVAHEQYRIHNLSV